MGRSWTRLSNSSPEGWMAPWSSSRISFASLFLRTMGASLFTRTRPLSRDGFTVFSGKAFIRDFWGFCSCGWECWGCWTLSCRTVQVCSWNRMGVSPLSFHRSTTLSTTNRRVFHVLACTKFKGPDTQECHRLRRHYSKWFPFLRVQNQSTSGTRPHQSRYSPAWD